MADPAGVDKRQPPQDEAAEQAVLGGMMLSKDAIADVVERLRVNDFYRPAHQNIYAAILDMYANGEPADAVTVAAELDRRGQLRRIGGAPYLHTLISTAPTAANAGFYAGIIAEKSLLRRLVEAGPRVVQYGYAGADGADVTEVVDRAQAEIYAVTERRRTEDYVQLEALLQPTMDELDAIQNNGGSARGVLTGFTDLDAVTNGLHPGQMIIIAARPGVGKALALDTPLPTPTGWTTMGEVAVGDTLIGADGNPTTVVAATPVMHDRPCYTVEFDDGTSLIADAEHQWPTQRGTHTTTQLRPGHDTIAAPAALTLPPIKPSMLAMTPYAAGRLLGEQSTRRAPAIALRDLRPYLRGSESQRRSLLRGLLYGAGQRDDDTVTIRLRPNRPLYKAFVQELLASLGYLLEPDSSSYTARFTDPRRSDQPPVRTVSTVRPIDSVAVRCVEVDNPDHTYLAGHSMVPTHTSTLGLDFMRSCSVKQGLASVIFSLEMSKSEIVMRLLSAETGIKLSDMRAGRMSDTDWTQLARRMGDLSDAPLFIDDSPNLTMMEIRAKARRLAQKHDLRLAVIDYLQLMSSGKKYESRQQEVSDFSRSIKLMAKELDIPVVAISQLNRGPEQRQDKRPAVSDLRESGSLEQDCDIVLLLHRPDASEPDDPRMGEADIIIGKHRNGPTRTISVAHQLHISRFANMARLDY
ncbi:replicative DNA helicase [Mycobacterium hubeiense]|uniref:replicative DNA helicase n=1 Tax=Mycobacterium hubeiense TaxID=1867256 RepID=UPI000C7F246B|nr:replicative DNA helicase [Mycobacterium sp. QGD 101]